MDKDNERECRSGKVDMVGEGTADEVGRKPFVCSPLVSSRE